MTALVEVAVGVADVVNVTVEVTVEGACGAVGIAVALVDVDGEAVAPTDESCHTSIWLYPLMLLIWRGGTGGLICDNSRMDANVLPSGDQVTVG